MATYGFVMFNVCCAGFFVSVEIPNLDPLFLLLVVVGNAIGAVATAFFTVLMCRVRISSEGISQGRLSEFMEGLGGGTGNLGRRVPWDEVTGISDWLLTPLYLVDRRPFWRAGVFCPKASMLGNARQAAKQAAALLEEMSPGLRNGCAGKLIRKYMNRV